MQPLKDALKFASKIKNKKLQDMKVFRNLVSLLTVFTILTASTSAFASSDPTGDAIKKSVINRMTYPTGLTPKCDRALVLVSFIVEPCGTVNILEVNASDECFKQHVLKKLSEMKFSEDECNEVVNVKFTFLK
jgi:hypothetical protein